MDRRDSLRPSRTPKKGSYVSPYAMETPQALSSPSSDSLTSKGTEDLEELAPLVEMTNTHTPPRTGSAGNTPISEMATDNHNNGEAEHIVVDAPALDGDDSMMLGADEDELEDEDDAILTPQHKRKRQSVNYILGESIYDTKSYKSTSEPKSKRRHGPKVRGIIIGVWRDSSEPVDEEKHVIFGFIDIHDRLRTRIYSMNRRGEELIGNVPTGAGGCWVTFERVIFEPHLQGLTPIQIKEYVKLRATVKLEDDMDARRAAELHAVAEARRIATANATNPSDAKPVIAHVRKSNAGRPSLAGRESLGASSHRSSGFQAVNSPHAQTPKAPAETKNTGVPLGYWAESDEPELSNKHAVFGVLSESDCFRAKVQRVTRDGRTMIGNYPVGAGAMWIKYDQIIFEPNLAVLTRPEVKEFCRIRQRQIANGEQESPKQREKNEKVAIRDARAIIAAQGNGFVEPTANALTASGRASPEPEVRHSARSEQKQAMRQQAEAEANATRLRTEKAKALAERHELTRKEVAQSEALVKERAEKELKHNINNLNKVWVAQQNATMNGISPASSVFGGGAIPSPAITAQPVIDQPDVKFHNGIRYERKTMGPFAGKLVGPPQIFSIDGEDFVEYRILTKPSFA